MPIPPIPNLSGHPVVAKGVLQFQSHLKSKGAGPKYSDYHFGP